MTTMPDVCHTLTIGPRLVLWRPGRPAGRRCPFTPIRRLTLLHPARADGSLGAKETVGFCAVHYDPMFAAVTAKGLAIIEDLRIPRDWSKDTSSRQETP